MTTFTLQAGMPAIPIAAGMKLKLEAVSPTTGAAVSGVKATAWTIYGLNVSQELDLIDEIPAWVPDGDQDV